MSRQPLSPTPSRLIPLLLTCTALAGCGREPDLVVRVSLDQIFSEELIREFEAQTGLDVKAQYDIEQTKTVGHVRAIIEEARTRPRTDVFWNNEIAQTIRLAELGLLQPYESPAAADVPATFKDPSALWVGFGARARVLIVNTDLVAAGQEPSGTLDLFDERWRGKCGIARPLTGTTLTHATALYQTMGEEWTAGFMNDLVEANGKGQVQILESNGQAMKLVENGELAWAFTDTDDFNVARMDGSPVQRVYPDQVVAKGCLQRDGEPLGTLLIPNSIMLLADAPHPENAKRFIDWVLSKELEERLANSRSAQIPVRSDVPRPAHVGKIGDFRAMGVDYVTLGRTIGERTEALKEIFLR
ncbi:MAG: extracellular solute-binding protein [Planctomycetota bacterium]|nr:extracellular solute-binding protein [Planctomycetota bacterium]